MRSYYVEPVYAFLILSFWLVVLSFVAWKKAHRRLQELNEEQNEVAYTDLSPVFSQVFWQLCWQVVVTRILILLVGCFVEPSSSHRSRPFADGWNMLFWPDFGLLIGVDSYLNGYFGNLPDAIKVMAIAIPFLSSYFLAALATIVAFLITLNYERNRYLQ